MIPKKKTSKYRGVSWHKSLKKWVATIGYRWKRNHLGCFDTDEEARKAYLKKELELYGKTFEPAVPIINKKNKTAKIPLSSAGRGKRKNHGIYFALVDLDDYERVNGYGWAVDIGKKGRIYSRANIKGKQTRMHRLIMNVTERNILVDHKDGNGLNNKRNNLRICSQSQNMGNGKKYIRKNRTSVYKGVFFNKKRGMWTAKIRHTELAHYENEIDAAKAYNKAAVRIYGKFARINNIQREAI